METRKIYLFENFAVSYFQVFTFPWWVSGKNSPFAKLPDDNFCNKILIYFIEKNVISFAIAKMPLWFCHSCPCGLAALIYITDGALAGIYVVRAWYIVECLRGFVTSMVHTWYKIKYLHGFVTLSLVIRQLRIKQGFGWYYLW